jgi:uncharacterized membrane protein
MSDPGVTLMYPMFKMLHLFSAIVFLGNITTGLFWKRHADRTRDARLIRHTLEGIIGADRWFTMPGVLGLVVFGFGAAGVGGLPMLRTGWILWSIVLFIASGVAFMAGVVPLQRRMAALAAAGERSGTLDWDAYHKLSRSWDAWGGFALLTPLAAAVLMILKPMLPGL